MIRWQQVQQLVAERGPDLSRIGLGRPVNERPQPRGLLPVGALEDVIPVLGDHKQQPIRWLRMRLCIGHGRGISSLPPPLRYGASLSPARLLNFNKMPHGGNS
jgi:hypothetical protein